MLQLHQCREQRMGVILMGPSGSGKSTLWRTLAAAHERLGKAPVVFTLSPKAMPRQRLLGYMDGDTRCVFCCANATMQLERSGCMANTLLLHLSPATRVEGTSCSQITLPHCSSSMHSVFLCVAYAGPGCREWTDGVLTACVRKAAKEPLEQPVWIVCDGSIDPEWIEALNSVLDDNRLLTMPNGERVQLTHNVNFIFECDSLRFASPATVSRCAVIYTSGSSREGGCDVIAARAARSLQGPQHTERACAWLADTFPKVLAWLQAQPAAAAVAAPLAAFASAATVAARSAPAATGAAVAMCRAIAALLRPGADTRAAFLAAAEEWCGGACIWGVHSGERPIDALQALRSQEASIATSGKANPEADVVLTLALQEHLAIVVPWFRAGLPILLAGPLGSGKRSLIHAALAHMAGTLRADVFCNAQMQADDVIHKLLQACPCPVRCSSSRLGTLLQ